MKASIQPRLLRDGTTVCRVYWRENGKQKTQTFADGSSAERFRANIEKFGPARAYEIAGVVDAYTDIPDVMTLAEYAEHHITHLTGVEDGTTKRYRRYVANDLDDIGQMPLPAITDTVIAGWVHYLQHERGNSGKTIANKHGFLAAVLKRAVHEGHIPANPAERTRLPRTDAKEEPVFLTRTQVDALVTAMPERLRPFVRWLVTSGMRYSEATALRIGDVTRVADGAEVRVRRAWKYTGTSYSKLGPPKSVAGRRTINVPAAALDGIDWDRPADTLVFVDTRGGRIRYPSFHETWSRAVKSAGVQCSPHDLRHTCASWMIKSGVPLLVVSRHLGHESVTVTANVYSHIDRGSFADAAAAIGKMLE